MAETDDAAIEQLVERYYDDLVRVARRKLISMPQEVANDEGAVVSSPRSFFSGVHGNQFPRLGDRPELWKVLTTLTIRKSIAQIRRHWKKSGEGARLKRTDDLQAFLDRGPGPEEVALMVDEARPTSTAWKTPHSKKSPSCDCKDMSRKKSPNASTSISAPSSANSP